MLRNRYPPSGAMQSRSYVLLRARVDEAVMNCMIIHVIFLFATSKVEQDHHVSHMGSFVRQASM